MPKVPTRTQTRLASWRLELLGKAGLYAQNQSLKLERKTAGLLAYLALEGETSHSKLAGLLWSDNTEERARANLRQCLHRLKTSSADLIHEADPVRLEPSVQVDAVQLESSSFLGDDGLALTMQGELLEGLDYEDQPDFFEWLEQSRARFRMLSSEALRREIHQLEKNLDFPAALEHAERWLAREPLLEEAYRTLMRLHNARGDRATALQVFKRCQMTLLQELGVQPSLETQALLQELEAHQTPNKNLTQKLEQIMLVGGEDFNAPLAASLLNLDPIEILSHLQTLQTPPESSLPSHLRVYLHAQIARQLEAQTGNPARIAHHWIQAQEPLNAVPHLLTVAKAEVVKHQFETAMTWFEQALSLDLTHGNQTRAFETLFESLQVRVEFDLGETTEQQIKRLFDLSNSGLQRAKAFLTKADYQQLLGHNQQVELDARAGIELLRGNDNLEVEAALNSVLSSALWAQSKLEEALKIGKYVIELNQTLGLQTELATSYANLASVYTDLQKPSQAIEYFEKALTIRCQLENRLSEAQTRVNLAVTQAQVGLARSSLQHLELAKNLLDKQKDAPIQMMQCLNEMAQRQLGFAQFDLALPSFEQSVAVGKSLQHWATPTVQSNQVFALITLGAFEEAQALLNELFNFSELRVSQRFGLLRMQIKLEAQNGVDTSQTIAELEQLAMPEEVIRRVRLDRLNDFSKTEQLNLCQTLLTSSQSVGSFGGQIIAQTKLAQALMQDQPDQALTASSQAVSLLERYTPMSFYQAETRLTQYQSLKANNLTLEATAQIENTLNWLFGVKTQQVPTKYQNMFLNQNPINKTILEAARVEGLNAGL